MDWALAMAPESVNCPFDMVTVKLGWTTPEEVSGRWRGIHRKAKNVSAISPVPKIIPRDMRKPLLSQARGPASPSNCKRVESVQRLRALLHLIDTRHFRHPVEGITSPRRMPATFLRGARFTQNHESCTQSYVHTSACSALGHLLFSPRFSSVISHHMILICEGVHHGQHCAGTDQCF